VERRAQLTACRVSEAKWEPDAKSWTTFFQRYSRHWAGDTGRTGRHSTDL